MAGVLLIAILFSFNVKMSEVGAKMRGSILQWMMLAGTLHISGLLISAYRWRMLLSACSVNASILNLMRSYLIGGFINWFLPTKIGGDIYRVLDSKTQCGSIARSFSVIFIEGITSIFGLILIGIVSAFIYCRSSGKGSATSILILLILSLFGFSLLALVLFFWNHFPDRIKKITERLIQKRFNKISETLLTVHEVLGQFLKLKRILGYAFLVSVMLQVNLILYYYFIIRGLGMTVSLAGISMVLPLIICIQLLHLTPNGIGVREVTFVYLLGHFLGISSAQAIAISLWDYVLAFFYIIAGGALYLLKREHSPILKREAY